MHILRIMIRMEQRLVLLMVLRTSPAAAQDQDSMVSSMIWWFWACSGPQYEQILHSQEQVRCSRRWIGALSSYPLAS